MGIKYGWAGKQAVIQVNEWAIKKEEYQKFLEDFKEKTLPQKKKENIPLKIATKGGITILFGLVGLGGSFIVDYFKDKSKLRQQLFLYGILNLYENDLDTFMKS